MSPSDLKRDARAVAFAASSPTSIDDALARAVEEANLPDRTWLTITRIRVLSVDDPHVGGYWVEVTPDG